MYLGVRASTGPKPLHVCSVGPVSTRHAVVCVFLGFIKITISPLTRAGWIGVARFGAKRARRSSGVRGEGVKGPECPPEKLSGPPHAPVSPFLGICALSRPVAPPTRLLGALAPRLDAPWPFLRRFPGYATERVPIVSRRGGQRLRTQKMAGCAGC